MGSPCNEHRPLHKHEHGLECWIGCEDGYVLGLNQHEHEFDQMVYIQAREWGRVVFGLLCQYEACPNSIRRATSRGNGLLHGHRKGCIFQGPILGDLCVGELVHGLECDFTSMIQVLDCQDQSKL